MRKFLVAMLLTATVLLPASTEGQFPLGGEFQVNEYTTGRQELPAVAAAADGRFVVVWQSFLQDGDAYGIIGRRHDSAGNALGGDFVVNGNTVESQEQPAVASDPSGNFIVVWESLVDELADFDVFGQRFTSAGVPNGASFQVNSFTTSTQGSASVAAAADGSFVVVWETHDEENDDTDIAGQRFSSTGAPLGGEFVVNTYTTGDQLAPAVAADSNGNFVVAWESPNPVELSSGIFAQRFDSAGVPVGSEFHVNQFTTANQMQAAVASDASGKFVIAWEGGGAQDGDGFGVFARRYGSNGVALGDEFQVNTYTTGNQSPQADVRRLGGTSRPLPGDLLEMQLAGSGSSGSRSSGGSSGSRSSGGSSPRRNVAPSVASDANGDFSIAWTSDNQDGSSQGIYAQRFDQNGAPVGAELQVNTYTTSTQSHPAVASDADGNFIIAWDSFGQDGSDAGVYAQRYTDSVCGNGTIEGDETCDAGAANGTAGSCCSATCEVRSAGSVCRASAGVCDVAETCDGTTAVCPADGLASSSTTCRAADGECDVAETCTGSSTTCPADQFAASSTTCRAADGECDVAETCSGTTAECPADGFAASSTTCRAADGECDVAETCSGSSATCPADQFASSSTTCRAAAGECDVAETCSGASATCPADTLAPAATVCRGSGGVCDVAEACSGASPSCPADTKSTAECRGSAGVCDVAEICDGVNDACPADGFASAATTCRAADGVCDVAETCSGAGAACPADGFAPAETVCRPSAGVCDVADTCSGGAGACPADAKSTAECRAANGECDAAESCDGTNDACPADGAAPAGTPCGGDASACTQDVCDGTGMTCTHPPVQPTGDCIVNGHPHRPCIAPSQFPASIIGTHGDDVIVGGPNGDLLHGLAGDDLICGGDGNDVIDGGVEDDTLLGGAGFDTLLGSFGTDVCKDGELNVLCEGF